MPPDSSLATMSNNLIIGAVAVYALAMLAYAAVFAYRRPRAAAVERETVAARVPVSVGAGGGGGSAQEEPPERIPPGAAGEERPEQVVKFTAESLGRYAVGLTGLGWIVQLVALTARGLAADRAPWANMYEFVCCVVFAAVTGLLLQFARNRAYYLGVYVMFPAVLGLGLATTVLYTPVSPLQPSLNSYWLVIHVLAAIVASGGFTVAAALTALYLCRDHQDREPERRPADSTIAAMLTRLPSARTLERLARQTVVFAFPIWTFAVIAGAIWADNAWGRYWGWDPKETWAFITWIVYAAYLHAQATTGWRGRKTAVIALVGYGCLLFNLVGINIWGSGLHSYAGL